MYSPFPLLLCLVTSMIRLAIDVPTSLTVKISAISHIGYTYRWACSGSVVWLNQRSQMSSQVMIKVYEAVNGAVKNASAI